MHKVDKYYICVYNKTIVDILVYNSEKTNEKI